MSGPEDGYETVPELVCGLDFGFVLHHLSSLTRWSGSRVQRRPENGPKQQFQIIVVMSWSERYLVFEVVDLVHLEWFQAARVGDVRYSTRSDIDSTLIFIWVVSFDRMSTLVRHFF